MKWMYSQTYGAFQTLEQPDDEETLSANAIIAMKAMFLQRETVP